MMSCDTLATLLFYSDMELLQCGDALLDRYEFSANTSHEVGWNFLAMGIFTIAFLITGFAGLMASTRK